MPEIDLNMTASELEQHELDCFETIQIVEQAETVWMEIEIALPLLENCLEQRVLLEREVDDPAPIQKPVEEYTRYIDQVREFLASVSDGVRYLDARGNTIVIGKPFETYEEAKKQADELEGQPSEVWSQVTLRVFDDALPEELLEQIVRRKKAPKKR